MSTARIAALMLLGYCAFASFLEIAKNRPEKTLPIVIMAACVGLMIFVAWPRKKQASVLSEALQSLPPLSREPGPPTSLPEIEGMDWQEIEPEEVPRPARYRDWRKPKPADGEKPAAPESQP
jgi:hypothetical protein